MAWLWSCSTVASSLPSDDLLGRACTVSAAPLLHHARSKERVSQQIRTISAAAPDAAQAPAVWAAGLSLRAAAVSWQPFSQVLFETADKVMPDRHAEILP